MYKHNIFFLNIYMHMCVFTAHTHILCKQKPLFWMRLIVWQHYLEEHIKFISENKI